MQPSYVICKNCYRIVQPEDVGISLEHYPTSDENTIEHIKTLAKQKLKYCPACGDTHFIRKVARKL